MKRMRAEEGEAVRVRQFKGLHAIRQGPHLRPGRKGGRAAARIPQEHAPLLKTKKQAVVPHSLVIRLNGKGGLSQHHAYGLPRQKNALSS